MGYGLIHIKDNKPSLMNLGVVHLKKYEEHTDKLKKIFERTIWLIEEYKPDEIALEAPFFGKNVQSMLKLGRAQGVAMAAALSKDIPVFEYAPKRIKQSITGNGNAAKEQVAAVLQSILKFDSLPSYLDATDGLAVALTHFFQNKTAGNGETSFTGWKAFAAANPKRIK
jgi:crossover junction endodeoxyribonuclease RuvC